MCREVFRLECLSKCYDGDQALRNVSLSLYEGEIVQLMADSELSQSIFARILGGLEEPDAGEIHLGGEPIRIETPLEGHRSGIHVVYKRNDLIPNLSVQDNLYLERPISSVFEESKRQKLGTQEVLAQLGMQISPDVPVSELTAEQTLLLQLGKAFVEKPRLVVIDYTYVLMPHTVMKRLTAVLQRLAAKNTAILILAQNPKGFLSIIHRMYVMQQGMITARFHASQLTGSCLEALVRAVFPTPPLTRREVQEEVLRVSNLSIAKRGIKSVSFSLHKGEILGLVSHYGYDMRHLANALLGIQRISNGRIYLAGKPVVLRSSAKAFREKVMLFSCEDRENGLLFNLSAGENLTISRLKEMKHGLLPSRKQERELFRQLNEMLSLGLEEPDRLPEEMSLAQQRRLNLARLLAMSPRVLILIEPTLYLDHAARQDILNRLVRYAKNGGSVIICTGGYSDLLQLSNRILVLRDPAVRQTAEEREEELAEQLYMFEGLMKKAGNKK